MAHSINRRRPVLFHFGASVGLALLAALGLWWLLSRQMNVAHLACCWLVAANVIAFGYYGFDKGQARRAGSRVPELVLHGLAVLGGSGGAYAGMRTFRHKTVKAGFRVLFWLIVAVQAALALWIAWLVWWA
jgi:uncharacterized membrane protein YsdA (DUF1294 family)